MPTPSFKPKTYDELIDGVLEFMPGSDFFTDDDTGEVCIRTTYIVDEDGNLIDLELEDDEDESEEDGDEEELS